MFLLHHQSPRRGTDNRPKKQVQPVTQGVIGLLTGYITNTTAAATTTNNNNSSNSNNVNDNNSHRKNHTSMSDRLP